MDLPIVRLTLERMRSIQRAVDDALARFDFEVEVGKIAERVLRDLLEQELKATLYDTTVRAAMKSALMKAMRRPG